MKTLNDFINDNIQEFNNAEPYDGHFNRFVNRLRRQETFRSISFRNTIIKIAAIFISVAIISTVMFTALRSWNQKLEALSMSYLNNELVEAEEYYAVQLDVYYKEIDQMGFPGSYSEKAKILKELDEMDIFIREMKNDLKNNPDNELIINAIINYYQLKLEMMEQIIAKINKTNDLLL